MANTKAEVNKRRRELGTYKTHGYSLDEIAVLLAKKYKVKKVTITQDWYHRDQWIDKVFDLETADSVKLVKDILTEQKVIKRECWKTYNNTKEDSIKLGAIKQLSFMNKEIVSMLQDFNILDKKPDKFEITGKDGGPIEISKYAQMSEEELIKEAEKHGIIVTEEGDIKTASDQEGRRNI